MVELIAGRPRIVIVRRGPEARTAPELDVRDATFADAVASEAWSALCGWLAALPRVRSGWRGR